MYKSYDEIFEKEYIPNGTKDIRVLKRYFLFLTNSWILKLKGINNVMGVAINPSYMTQIKKKQKWINIITGITYFYNTIKKELCYRILL